MNLYKIWTKRFVMVSLFILALGTTFQSVSGVEAQTFKTWMMDKSDNADKVSR